MTNLASAQPERVRRMMRRVWNNIEATGDRALVNAHYYSMRFAAVGPSGE